MSKLAIEDYIRIIAMVMEVPMSEILSPTRVKIAVDCRRLICLVCMDRGFTVRDLASKLSRDRKSIHNMIETGRFMAERYTDFGNQYEEIKRRLK
jgi:hypothetical protein